MRILYGVCGDGYGHSSRALVIGKYLQEKGHEIIILTYGRAYRILKERFKTFRVKGFQMIFTKGVLDKVKTLQYNLENFPKNLRKLKRFHKLVKEFKPELCISDMEPIVPILAYWNKLPLISVDNQHRLTNLKFEVPKKYIGDFIIAKQVVNNFVRRAEKFIITSFTKMPIKKKNTIIIPPIIRKEVQKLRPKQGNKILVYLTRKNRKILKVLKQTKEQFVIYGYDKNRKIGNLHFKKKNHFLNDLRDCRAVIGTAGYTLISEAIYLKKPYLAMPLQGQFEQVLNALFLKKSGMGTYVEIEEFDKEKIREFLGNLGSYKKKLKACNYDNEKLYKTLDKTIKKNLKRGRK
jgi:uncharacterized protein (TIGR00661 family)